MSDNPIGREEAREARGYADPITPRYSASTIPAVEPRTPFSPFPEPVRRPAEPEPGTVIGFAKAYREDGPLYSFAAVRVDRLGWYLTGPQYSGQPMKWDALLDFIGGPAEWFRVGVVTEWSPLGDL